MKIDEKLLEVLDKTTLSERDFEFVKNHKDVIKVENCGHSGRRPEEFRFSTKLVNGKEINIYKMIW